MTQTPRRRRLSVEALVLAGVFAMLSGVMAALVLDGRATAEGRLDTARKSDTGVITVLAR
jgi:hypothetical protein